MFGRRNQVRIVYRGWNDRTAEPELYDVVVPTPHEALTKRRSIDHYADLELVSATMESR